MTVSTARRGRALASLAAGAALVAVDAAWLVFGWDGKLVAGTVDGVAIAAACVLAAVLAGTRARAEGERAPRLGWTLLAAFAALLLATELIAALIAVPSGAMAAPFPSLADAAGLAATGLLPVAVLLLGGARWGGSWRRLVLDEGIVTGALMLLAWITVIQPLFEATSRARLAVAVSLAYCAGDVVAVVIVLAAVGGARRIQPSLLLVGLAVVAFSVSNVLFLYVWVGSGQVGPNFIDVGTVAGLGLVAFASQVRGQPLAEMPALARLQVLVPYGALALAVVPVADAILHRRDLDPLSQVLLTAVIGLVMARQLTAVVEEQTLAGRLTATLAVLRRTFAEREIVLERAPVGICQLDREGRLTTGNQALATMLGVAPPRLIGRPFTSLVAEADREREAVALAALADGRGTLLTTECRLAPDDGRTVWASVVATSVLDATGQPESVVAIVEDISERRREADRAAQIQRQLLPDEPPEMDDYQLAAACRPALDVAGDFYDWILTGDGCLDLTVADVMGKGVPAALIMAVVRTALRSTPSVPGPAARVRAAADSISASTTADGLFVTLFHASLAPATGVLRYVDAGHGYCAIRRRDGRLESLCCRSLPIGVMDDRPVREGTARLGTGDALIVYSDGLVETPERSLSLSDFAPDMDAAVDAGDLVARLLARMPARLPDDVTVLVLRRREPRDPTGLAAVPAKRWAKMAGISST
jgi:PAS domain S-box-containing protein